jgi:sulfhydrogenase subunit gamma (sulfur reductase)
MSTCHTANPYLAKPVTIEKITVENDARDLKTFRLAFNASADRAAFQFASGQFAMLSVPGAGECPIGIASSPLDSGYVEFTVKRYPTGVVSSAVHSLEEGDVLGLRGPYGNSYPLEAMRGKNVLIVGGGFAFTTLRSAIRYMLDKANRSKFGNITAIYGARSPGELLYKDELKAWQAGSDIQMHVTVDKGQPGWTGREGFVPTVVTEVKPSSADAVALVCGPPVMLKFTIKPLLDLGFAPQAIFTSLERRMSCGIGKCGRCDIGGKYVCKDGPVFSYKQMLELTGGQF